VTAPALNPWAGWLHCEECGTDADAPCYGLDNKPAVEVCDGRLFRDAEPDPPPSKTPSEVRERKTLLQRQRRPAPRYKPCTHCGASVKLTGAASSKPEVYCGDRECRRAYDRMNHARRRAAAPPVTVPCCWCGVQLPLLGGRSTAKRAWCGEIECERARKRQCEAGRRQRQRTGEVTT
jgi:hypothetical protein